MRPSVLLLFAIALLPTFARAELVQSAPDAALIEHHFQVSRSAPDVWDALVHPELWWPEDHTWSGSRANLRLEPAAGGCYCENWPGGSVEHARVVMAIPERLLRMRGALGPLQQIAVTAVLTIRLEPVGGGTAMTVTYRISGDASHKLSEFASVVDKVLGQQFGSLASFASQARP
jgi:uncharacterized protein YndB with AHSA1/START domain